MQSHFKPSFPMMMWACGGMLVAGSAIALVLSGSVQKPAKVCEADSSAARGRVEFVVDSVAWHDELNYRKIVVGHLDPRIRHYSYSREQVSDLIALDGRVALFIGYDDLGVGGRVIVDFDRGEYVVGDFHRPFGVIRRLRSYNAYYSEMKRASGIAAACLSH